MRSRERKASYLDFRDIIANYVHRLYIMTISTLKWNSHKCIKSSDTGPIPLISDGKILEKKNVYNRYSNSSVGTMFQLDPCKVAKFNTFLECQKDSLLGDRRHHKFVCITFWANKKVNLFHKVQKLSTVNQFTVTVYR